MLPGNGAPVFIHPCHVCGKPGHFGEHVKLSQGQAGTWTCFEHWPGRAAAAERRREQAGDAF